MVKWRQFYLIGSHWIGLFFTGSNTWFDLVVAFWLAPHSITPLEQMLTLSPIPVCLLVCALHAKGCTVCFIPSSCNERRWTITGDLPSCFERRWNISRVKYVRAKMLHNSIAWLLTTNQWLAKYHVTRICIQFTVGRQRSNISLYITE